MSNVIGAVHDQMLIRRHSRILADRLGRELRGVRDVLDAGCGDGGIDQLIQESVPHLSIKGIDVLIRPRPKIKVTLFDGRTVPFPDQSFDAVMFVDVLHHTDDPMVLLREARRVARKLVLIKDHTMDGPLAYATLRFMDWIGNAHHGVALPYNYWPERRWREAFASLKLSVASWEPRIGLYPFPLNLAFERRLHFIAALAPER